MWNCFFAGEGNGDPTSPQWGMSYIKVGMCKPLHTMLLWGETNKVPNSSPSSLCTGWKRLYKIPRVYHPGTKEAGMTERFYLSTSVILFIQTFENLCWNPRHHFLPDALLTKDQILPFFHCAQIFMVNYLNVHSQASLALATSLSTSSPGFLLPAPWSETGRK